MRFVLKGGADVSYADNAATARIFDKVHVEKVAIDIDKEGIELTQIVGLSHGV